jgi:signal peptidase I
MSKINIKQLIKENMGFLLFTFLLFASRSSFADWYVVPTGSMLPTIVQGDRIFVDKMAYRLEIPFTDIEIMQTGQPKRGDIVVFNSVIADTRMVKRLIGEPGDKITMIDNQLVINGEKVIYSALETSQLFTEHLAEASHLVQFTPVEEARDNFAEIEVPQGHYLVLGDNRNNSADSRYYGFIPAIEIQGKAQNVIVSLNPENFYIPRKERFFSPLI